MLFLKLAILGVLDGTLFPIDRLLGLLVYLDASKALLVLSLAELIGHHMALGFGATEDTGRAQGWYQTAIAALEGGAEPVFAPGQPERVALVKAASTGLTQPGLPQPVQASGGAAALPTFGGSN